MRCGEGRNTFMPAQNSKATFLYHQKRWKEVPTDAFTVRPNSDDDCLSRNENAIDLPVRFSGVVI